MKKLFLLRHAKSSWKDTLLDDHDRSLNGRGRAEAPLVGNYLRQCGLSPACVAVSTARRAIQTAADVLSIIRYDGQVLTSPRLYLAEEDVLIAFIAQTPQHCSSLMVIAHNPGLEQLLERLTGQSAPMPTASLAHIDLNIDHWTEIEDTRNGILVELWRPVTAG